jgi:DNA-binding SARP family transcriptional activator
MAAGLEFCLLGPLMVRCDGAVVSVQPGKQRAVLAVLLLNAGQVVRLDRLTETLWGSGPPPSARVTVQNYVMRLRKALSGTGQHRISTQPGGYVISVDADELDVTRFETLLSAAGVATRGGQWATAAAQARAALSLWRGEPLADVRSELLAQREVPRLAEMQLQALDIRIGADLHLGHEVEVIAELRRLGAEHPFRERFHLQLMLALYRCSRRADALEVYQVARKTLIAELGVEPGAELRRLQQRILKGDLQPSAIQPGCCDGRASSAAGRASSRTRRTGSRATRRTHRRGPTG